MNEKRLKKLEDVLNLRWEYVGPREVCVNILANTETDFFIRVANLEAACFQNGINNGTQSPIFQGATMPPKVVLSGTGDAITYPGVNLIAATAADATTLATPTPGTDDMKTVTVQDVGGYSHTVTTAAGKLIVGATGVRRTATFSGNAGASFTLRAYSGLWYLVDAATGITFS
jgi:hypothetical protein